MPQVPREQASVLPSALPGVRVQPVATPQAFGAGIADVGQDLGLAIYAKARREADETALTIASRKLTEAQVSLQVEIGNLHGRDAFGGERDSNGVSASRDAVELLNDEWRKVVDHIELSEIHNDTQRREFRRAVSKRYEQLNEFTQFHVNKERVKFQDDETGAFIKASQDAARLNATDPDFIQHEKLVQREKLIEYGERNGLGKWVEGAAAGPGEPTPNPRSHDWIGLLSWGEVYEGRIADENEVRGPGMFIEGGRPSARMFQGTPAFERMWAETVSRTNTEVVKGLIAKGADRDAKAYYEANIRDFTATDRDHIQPIIAEGSTQGEALRLSRLMTKPDMTRAQVLRELDTITDPKLHKAVRELALQRVADREAAAEGDAKTAAAGRARAVAEEGLDRTQALRVIDGIEDPKLQRFTRELVLQHFSDQEAAEKRAHDQTFDTAVAQIDKAVQQAGGREVNPRVVIGPEQWIALTPAERASLTHQAAEALHPTDRLNDDKKWFEFHSVLSHEDIAKLSPREYRTQYRDTFSNDIRRVADSYYNQIRNAVAKQGAKDPELSVTQTFKDQVEDAFRTSGLLGELNKPKAKWDETEVKRYVLFERQAAAAIEQTELAKGKKLTPTEKQTVINGVKDEAIKKLWVHRGGLGLADSVLGPAEKSLIDLDESEKGKAIVPLDKIPNQDLEDLRRYITGQGKTVTIDKLRRAYAQRILNNRKAFDAIVNE